MRENQIKQKGKLAEGTSQLKLRDNEPEEELDKVKNTILSFKQFLIFQGSPNVKTI